MSGLYWASRGCRLVSPGISTVGATARTTIEEAVEAFLDYLQRYRGRSPATVDSYCRDFRRFSAHCAHRHIKRVGQVERGLLLDFATSIPLGPRAIRRNLAAVASLCRWLTDIGALRESPATRLPLPALPKSIPRGVSPETVKALLGAARTSLERAVILLLATTGIRRAELTGIRLPDLDLENGQLLVRGKGARERVVPLLPETMAAIREFLVGRNGANTDLLFTTMTAPNTVNRVMRRLVRVAGVGNVTPHQLRHTFATQLVRSGVDIRTIQELLGHANITMTVKYLHSDTRTKAAAVRTLAHLLS